MSKHFKILLWVENSYDALLLEREIATFLPESTIVVSGAVDMTLDMLTSSKFDCLVTDAVSPIVKLKTAIEKVDNLDDDIKIIALINNEEKAIKFSKSHKRISDFLVKSDGFHKEIPLIIENSLKESKKVYQVSKRKDSEKEISELIKITTGTLLHEINNPLMTILGMCELILEDEYLYNEELVEKLKIIYKSSQRILEATNKISKISKPRYKETYNGRLFDLDKSLK